MTHVVRVARTAMACRCEVVVMHDTVAEATHAAEAAIEEIGRVEALLSRFDPASEVSRINRDAFRGPVMVDHEFYALLSRCFTAWRDTNGIFDITSGSPTPLAASRLMEAQRAIQFDDANLQLDLGGCGKGYALDCAAAILRAAGVVRAGLHAGTSSVLVIGSPPDDVGWPIALVDPRDRDCEVTRVTLADRALSTSAVSDLADVIDPRTGRPLTGTRSCTAIARTAFDAEVWSTAGLVLGRAGFPSIMGESQAAVDRILWIEAPDADPARLDEIAVTH